MRFVIRKSFAEAGEPSRDFGGDHGRMTFAVPLNKLRERAKLGLGELQAQQLAVERMMRTQEEGADQPRRVEAISDVTRGLGLEPADAERIERAIEDTNPTYTPRSGVQRIFQARGRLVDVLRAMKHVDSYARVEVQRRAMAWWRLHYQTDVGRNMGPDSLRWPVAKSEAYPPDHEFGMQVPRGGASCARCRFLVGADRCSNKYFNLWRALLGEDPQLIPLPAAEYCCDVFEPEEAQKSMRHVLRAAPVQLEFRPERLLKAINPLPTSGGVGGPTNPQMGHPELPDFYSLYFAPEAQARQQVEAKQSRRRRLSLWRDLDRSGFHGPIDKPELRYKMGDTSLPDFATLKPMKHYLTEAELRRAQKRIVAGTGLDYEVVGGAKKEKRRGRD